MKKIIAVIIVLIFLPGLTGCEAIQRKFVRKNKKEPLRPKFYQEGLSSETRPNIELYMMHYMYWKTWHEDLVVKAGDNAKRDKLAFSEVFSNLKDMQKRLLEEKAKEIDVYIEEMQKIAREIEKGKAGTMRLAFLREQLDRIRARIVRKFYYKKIADYILPDRKEE